MRIDPIDPAEAVVLAFDFSLALDVGETLSGTIATSVTTVLGTDATPSAVLNGVATFGAGNKTVLVPVKGGLVDCDYAIKVVVGTTNAQKTLALVAHLPIREDF
jgi:hypothetical protein